MSSHHAQTAMRFLDPEFRSKQGTNTPIFPKQSEIAQVHATLEVAEQLERLANMAERAMVSVEAMKKTVEEGVSGVEAFFSPDGGASSILTTLARMFFRNDS